jgi:hypothetical protein
MGQEALINYEYIRLIQILCFFIDKTSVPYHQYVNHASFKPTSCYGED